MTIIIVTHEADIAQYTKRIVLFRDGRIHRDYPVERQRDAREVLAQLPVSTDEEEDEDEPLGNS